MPDFIEEYESDEAIAESMGLNMDEFRGVCGEDDEQLDHLDYLNRLKRYREEYDSFKGEGTEDGYIKVDKDGVGYRNFDDYVITQEMEW